MHAMCYTHMPCVTRTRCATRTCYMLHAHSVLYTRSTSGMACLAQAQASCVRDGTGIRTQRVHARRHGRNACRHGACGGTGTCFKVCIRLVRRGACSGTGRNAFRVQASCVRDGIMVHDGTGIVCARRSNRAGRGRWHAQALCVRDGTSIMCARWHGQCTVRRGACSGTGINASRAQTSCVRDGIMSA
jgi:hypothetical protein